MKKKLLIALIVCLAAPPPGRAAAVAAANHVQPAQQESQLSEEQLDNLMAPIALYPDPLLAQLFPASTFVEQIEQAARWLRANPNNTAGVDNQSWDVSVKSVAHYPQVVYMMAEKMDWTTALGQSYVNQSTDVFTSIQRLRARAKSAGNLVTSKEQQVIVEQEVIKIVPAQPQVIYVPTYNPQVVYVQQAAPSGPSTGTVVAATVIAFGAGLAIGAWLNNDCNWHTHTVYYHGWRGTGWVSVSSAHVHTSSVYVNRSYTTVNVNRTVVNRNVNYNNIGHYNSVSRNVNYSNVNRASVNRANVNVNNANINRNINTNDARLDDYRGRQTAAPATRGVTPSNSAFGGYGNGGEVRAQSERGRASRSSAQPSRDSGSRRAASGNSAKGGRARAGRRK